MSSFNFDKMNGHICNFEIDLDIPIKHQHFRHIISLILENLFFVSPLIYFSIVFIS